MGLWKLLNPWSRSRSNDGSAQRHDTTEVMAVEPPVAAAPAGTTPAGTKRVEMKLRVGALSITGNFRENNEDACFVDPQLRYILVADGMGGQSAGERASGMAIDLIPRSLNLVDLKTATPVQVVKAIDDAVEMANTEIMALGQLDPKFHNMGTTLTFLVATKDTFFVGGVGDSRGYLLRGGVLEQLTTDHSLTQALIDAGTLSADEAANHRYRNVLYRYLGTKEGSTGTAPRHVEPHPGDRFILCSDGVTGGASDATMAEILKREHDPQVAAQKIVKAAEDGGSKDNITCVTVYVDP